MEEKHLTNLEILIMKSVWSKKELMTAYDIIEDLKLTYHKDYSRSTIRTYLTSLTKKGFIQLERHGKFSYIYPLVTREAYQKQQMQRMKELWFDGNMKNLASALTKTITEEEKNELTRLLDMDD